MTRKEALSKAIMTLIYFQVNFCKSKEAVDNTQAIIDTLERIEKEPRWIPVSERLPNIGETVLCQCQVNIYEVLKLTVDGWYHDNEHCYMEGFVIAWMPLLEKYKAGSESEDKWQIVGNAKT